MSFSRIWQNLTLSNKVCLISDIEFNNILHFILDSKCILIYQSLYAFLLGPTLLKSQKSNPSSNASTQFSITNPENQTRNLFFLFVNDITNLHATSEPHDDKSNFPKYESSAFPVIVSVGKSLKNIDNFYIVYKTIFFKFDNFLNALDVCFKLYHVLDLYYSIESYNVWLFIQTYFYEFDTISDKTYSTVTNLINQIKNGN